MTMSFFRTSLLMFKEMLFPNDNSSFKLENFLHLVLFLIVTPLAILFTLVFMLILSSGVALLQLIVLLMQNTLAYNLIKMVDFINHTLVSCRKVVVTTFSKKKVITASIKVKTWASRDSGIDSPNNSEVDHDDDDEEFAEPHDAWAKELGTGTYDPDFEEGSETLYLVFWYYVCNNILM